MQPNIYSSRTQEQAKTDKGRGGRLILSLLIKKLELSAYLYVRYYSNRLILVVLILLLLLLARIAT